MGSGLNDKINRSRCGGRSASIVGKCAGRPSKRRAQNDRREDNGPESHPPNVSGHCLPPLPLVRQRSSRTWPPPSVHLHAAHGVFHHRSLSFLDGAQGWPSRHSFPELIRAHPRGALCIRCQLRSARRQKLVNVYMGIGTRIRARGALRAA